MADGLFGAVPITGLLVNSVLRRGGTPGDASRSRRRARFTYSAFVALLFNAAVVACIVAAVAKHDRSFVGLAIVLAPLAILADAGLVAMTRDRSPTPPDKPPAAAQ